MKEQNKNSKLYAIIIVILTITGSLLFFTLLILKQNVLPNIIQINDNNYPGKIIKDNGMEFVNNEFIIMFNNDVSKTRASEILNKAGLRINSYLDSINGYTVTSDKCFSSYKSISKYCQNIKNKYKEIYCINLNIVTHID